MADDDSTTPTTRRPARRRAASRPAGPPEPVAGQSPLEERVAGSTDAADLPAPRPGPSTRSVGWAPVEDVDADRLAFDHEDVLAAGVERARAKLEYSPYATAFCAEEFTVAELRHVYEATWGTALDPRNFHRKVTGTPGFLVPVGRGSAPGPGGGRPAALFRRGTAGLLHPAMLRPARG